MKRVKRRRGRKSRYHRGVHLSVKSSGECRYRSGWELALMQHMDNDPRVVSYSYESFTIPYVSNARTKKVRRYIPDFLVKYADGRTEVIEVKQLRKVNRPLIVKKTLAARDWCRQNDATFVMLTEIELRAMGVL